MYLRAVVRVFLVAIRGVDKEINMDLKNLKVPIGLVVVIVVQAFGIIWYVAQLDSTVKTLDSSVATIQESMADTDIAVLQTEVDNLKGLLDELRGKFDLERDIRHTTLDDFDERLSDIEKVQAVIDNEMRTIMTDHEGFGDVLSELQKSGVLPTGEKRQYGNYGD